MSPRWTACLGKVLCVVLVTTSLETMILIARGQDDAAQETEDTREQLVLFANGRMLSGKVSRNGGGYLIEQENGRIQVPAEDVKFVAKDLRDAYRKQRDSIVEPTPATHLALANWCISHRLLDDANEELKRCLAADPDNPEARRLLQRLTDTIRSNLPHKPIEPPALKTLDGFQQPEAESLGGLSKDSAAMFTSRIQPLLINKCGNAACHGSTSSNNFKLIPSRAGSSGSRQNTERNLAETLKHLDLDEISRSALLRVSKGSHGGRGTIFVGPAGAEQMKQIRDWAVTVVREKQAKDHDFDRHRNLVADNSAKNRAHKVVPASYTEEPASVKKDKDVVAASEREGVEEPTPPHRESSSPPRRLKPSQIDAKAQALEPDDAFNPEQFNRRYRY